MNESLIFAKDVQSEGVDDVLSRIRDENLSLYNHLIASLEKSPSVGIRRDVIEYFSDHAMDFKDDERYIFHIVDFACNPKMTVEHLRLVDDYFYHNDSDRKFSMDDFGVVFSACVEKNIPISEIKSLFYSDKDVMEIYASVDAYISQPENNSEETRDEVEPEMGLVEHSSTSETIPNEVDTHEYNRVNEVSDVDMFNNLVTLMATTDIDEVRFINTAQDKFKDMLQQLQDVSSSISVFSTDFINSMKRDKEEIKRLNAMILLMKKLVSQKQGEINELRGEVSKLNSRIRSFESAEFKQDALREKVGELYKLAANTGDGKDSMFLF